MGKIRKWISKDLNGFIFLWYHADNEEPWNLPNLVSKEFILQGSMEAVIHTHVQEFAENSIDLSMKFIIFNLFP